MYKLSVRLYCGTDCVKVGRVRYSRFYIEFIIEKLIKQAIYCYIGYARKNYMVAAFKKCKE